VPFDTVTLGNSLILGTLIVAFATYRLDRRKDMRDRIQARETSLQEQTQMHMENKHKLETLTSFTQFQDQINSRRDKQISELSSQTQQLATQTALLTQMVAAAEKRLVRIEDKL
jgi:uncharacterized protein (DUF3084 family)